MQRSWNETGGEQPSGPLPESPSDAIEVDPELEWMLPLVSAAESAGLVSAGVVGRLLVQDQGAGAEEVGGQQRPTATTSQGPISQGPTSQGPISPGDWETPYGSCWEMDTAGKPSARYEIRIATASPLSILFHRVELRPLPRREQVDTLAHELAHTRHQDHGPEHARLTEEILGSFTAIESSNQGVGLPRGES